MSTKDKTPAPFLNPYFGGILLGVILLMTFYITGRGLGATGAIKSSVIATVQEISPQHANESDYYNLFIREDRNTLNTWLVFEAIGLIAGAFLSGALSRRLTWKVEHSPKITSRTRLIFAFLGGALFGIGSQFARLYERGGPEWFCGAGHFRFSGDDLHIWVGIPFCLFCPKTMDLTGYNPKANKQI